MNSTTDNPKPVTELKYPIRRNQLAKIYKVDIGVIFTWFTDLGITHRSTLSPKEIVSFINHYGWPTDRVIPVIPNVEIRISKLTAFDKAG
jgi:hypothetical protein